MQVQGVHENLPFSVSKTGMVTDENQQVGERHQLLLKTLTCWEILFLLGNAKLLKDFKEENEVI
jgi:hypothetical protein